jgi:tRNA threonylcarbamoyladenosine biosynthesis protein TsaB
MTVEPRPSESPQPRTTRLLAIATSTDWCSVALLRDGPRGPLVDCVSERAGTEHSRRVLPIAQSLLREAGLGLRDLHAFAFDAGPGSFTGLRIGCGVVQGLGFALEVPVLAVSSLEALAWQAGSTRVLAAIDARMNEVYVAALGVSDSGPRLAAPIGVLAASDAAGFLAQVLDAPAAYWRGAADLAAPGEADRGGRRDELVAIGSAFARHPSLADGLQRRGVAVEADAFPRADAIAEIGLLRLARGEGLDASLASPIYVRDKVALDVDEQRRLRDRRASAGAPG